jgi:hypothetical protein
MSRHVTWPPAVRHPQTTHATGDRNRPEPRGRRTPEALRSPLALRRCVKSTQARS